MDRTRSAVERIASSHSISSMALSEDVRRVLASKLVIAAAKGTPGLRNPNRAIFLDEVVPAPTSTMTTR